MSLDTPFIDQRIATAMQALGSLPDTLPARIMQCGDFLAEKIIGEQKIVIAGVGRATPLAHLFYHNLVHQPPDIRPVLPAILLAGDSSGFSEAVSQDYAAQALLRPLAAIAQAGDVLLLVCDNVDNTLVNTLLQAAGDRQLSSMVVGAGDNAPFATDALNILLPPENDFHASQLLLTQFILQCLNDIIDERIFGGY